MDENRALRSFRVVMRIGIVAGIAWAAALAWADEPATIAPPPPDRFGYPGDIGPSRGWYVWHKFDPQAWEVDVSRDPPGEIWKARVLPWCTTYRSQSYGARPDELFPGERVNVFFNPDGRTKWGYVVHFQDELSQMRGHNHAWQVREVEPGDRWFRASLWMGNEKKLDESQQPFWIDLDCEKWRDGRQVDRFPLKPDDHVWMTWVWQNGQRVVKRIVDAASCDALKARQERTTKWRLIDDGLPGVVTGVDGATVKLLLFSTYWSQARQFKPGQSVDVRPAGEAFLPDRAAAPIAAKLETVKFGGTYGSGPTNVSLTFASPEIAARVAARPADSLVFLRSAPVGDAAALATLLAQLAESNETPAAATARFTEGIVALSDPKLRTKAIELAPPIERAAGRGSRLRKLAEDVAAANGTLATLPGGPDWLRDLVGNDAMRSFDHAAVVDLLDKRIVPKSGQRNSVVDDEWIKKLEAFTDVESLELHSTAVTNAGVETIGSLKSLKRLSLTLLPVTGDCLEHLSGLAELQRLSLASTQCTGEGCRHLVPLKTLENLNFHSCGVTDAGLAEIGLLTSLERLEIVHTKFTDAGAKHLAGLTNLRRLQIGSRDATGAAVEPLKALPLRELDLHDGQASDEGLKHAAEIGTLRVLRVYGPVTDAGAANLARLEKLETLVLGHAPITDATLDALHGLKRLATLDVTGGKLSDEAVERLRKAVPGLRIQR